VYDLKGAAVGEVDFPDGLMVLDRGGQAVHDAVVAHRAALRAGTASTRRKGEVAGSNRKPWRQKGTGRARAGYRQSPVWRGGGVAFGPHPRDYAMRLPRGVARLAFRRAFSDRLAAGEVRVLESLSVPEPKTRRLVAVLRDLGVEERALIVVEKPDRNLALAARNLPDVAVSTAQSLSTYEVLDCRVVLITRAALDAVRQRMAGPPAGAS
jgi:large subunit ribosomal protein L4